MTKVKSPRRTELNTPQSAITGPTAVLLAGAVAAVLAFAIYKYMGKSKWNEADHARFEQIMSEMKKPKATPAQPVEEKKPLETPKVNPDDF